MEFRPEIYSVLDKTRLIGGWLAQKERNKYIQSIEDDYQKFIAVVLLEGMKQSLDYSPWEGEDNAEMMNYFVNGLSSLLDIVSIQPIFSDEETPKISWLPSQGSQPVGEGELLEQEVDFTKGGLRSRCVYRTWESGTFGHDFSYIALDFSRYLEGKIIDLLKEKASCVVGSFDKNEWEKRISSYFSHLSIDKYILAQQELVHHLGKMSDCMEGSTGKRGNRLIFSSKVMPYLKRFIKRDGEYKKGLSKVGCLKYNEDEWDCYLYPYFTKDDLVMVYHGGVVDTSTVLTLRNMVIKYGSLLEKRTTKTSVSIEKDMEAVNPDYIVFSQVTGL